MTPRPRRSCHRDDRGLTLVELLVTTVIAGLVLPLVIGILITAQQQTSSALGTADAVGDVRLSVAETDHRVRMGAGPLSFDSPTPLTVPSTAFGFWTAYATSGAAAAAPRCVQFKVVDGTLRERSFAVTSPPAPAWDAAAVVGRGVSSSAPFSAVDGAPGTVRVRLTAQVRARTVSIDSSLTVRNTTTAATAACGVF